MPRFAWLVIVAGFLFELWYMLVRGYPAILDSFRGASANPEVVKLLWLYRWQTLQGWGIGVVLLVALYLWLRLRRVRVPLSLLLLGALALFSTRVRHGQ